MSHPCIAFSFAEDALLGAKGDEEGWRPNVVPIAELILSTLKTCPSGDGAHWSGRFTGDQMEQSENQSCLCLV